MRTSMGPAHPMVRERRRYGFDQRPSSSPKGCRSRAATPTSAWDLLVQHRRRRNEHPSLLPPPPPPPPPLPPPPPPSPSHGSSSVSTSSSDASWAWLRLPPGVHELAGEAGAGKTQVALSLCADLVVAADRENGGDCSDQNHSHPVALYLSSTKSKTSQAAERLSQMLRARGLRPDDASRLLRRVWVRDVPNLEALLDLLHELLLQATTTAAAAATPAAAPTAPPLPRPSAQHPRLLVLDSAADLVRGEGPGGYAGAFQLRQLSLALEAYGRLRQSAVLSLNQVAHRVATNSLRPALGLTWEQGMDRSYFVSRSPSPLGAAAEGPTSAQQPSAGRRTLELRRSSEHGVRRAVFGITAGGTRFLADPEDEPAQAPGSRPSPADAIQAKAHNFQGVTTRD